MIRGTADSSGGGRHAQPEPRRGDLTDRYVPLKPIPRGQPPDPPADLPRRPPSRDDLLTFPARRPGRGLTVLATLALVGVLTAAGWYAFDGTRFGTGRTAGSGAGTGTEAAPPLVAGHDISSQDHDPNPLTATEVFPTATVSVAGASYQVATVEQTQDCHPAVVGELVPTLNAAGCRGVVRATLTSADRSYVVTAGIFDLHDAAGAQQAANGIGTLIELGRGRFTGLPGGAASQALTTAATRAGWEPAGHFLAYGVAAPATGSPTAQSTVDQILRDVVEGYLTGQVIQARAGGHG